MKRGPCLALALLLLACGRPTLGAEPQNQGKGSATQAHLKVNIESVTPETAPVGAKLEIKLEITDQIRRQPPFSLRTWTVQWYTKVSAEPLAKVSDQPGVVVRAIEEDGTVQTSVPWWPPDLDDKSASAKLELSLNSNDPVRLETEKKPYSVKRYYSVKLTPSKGAPGDLIELVLDPTPDRRYFDSTKVKFGEIDATIRERAGRSLKVFVPEVLPVGIRSRLRLVDPSRSRSGTYGWDLIEPVPFPVVAAAVSSPSGAQKAAAPDQPFGGISPWWLGAMVTVNVLLVLGLVLTYRWANERIKELAAVASRASDAASRASEPPGGRLPGKVVVELDVPGPLQGAVAGQDPTGEVLPKDPALGTVPEVPQGLVEAIEQGQVVLYAGSDVGALAGLPTWEEGLSQVVELAAKLEPSQNWDPLRDVVRTSDYTTVMDLLLARLARETVLKLARQVFDPPRGGSPRVYAALGEIPFAGVVNRNWDPRIEEALSAHAPLVLTSSDSEQFEPLLRGERFFLVNIDGDLNQPGTVVLSTEEYRRAIAANDWFAKFLTGCFTSKILLFIGASLIAIDDFLSGLRLGPQPSGQKREHFALVPIGPDFVAQQERFIARHGIRLLGFHPTAGYPQVMAFLEDLRQRAGGRAQPRAATRTPRLDRIKLTNIGPFASLDLELHKAKETEDRDGDGDGDPSEAGAWNVLLGNNGCGKSTLLRAVALGLCGDDREAREAAAPLLRVGEPSGQRSRQWLGLVELEMGGQNFTTRLRGETDGRVVVESSVSPLQAGRWVVLGFPALRGATQKNPAGPSGEGRREPVVRDVLPLLQGVVDWRLDSLKQWIIRTHTQANSTVDPSEARRNRQMLDTFFKIFAAFVPGLTFAPGPVDSKLSKVLVETDDGPIPLEQVSQGTGSVLCWVGTLLQRMYEIYRDIPDGERPEHQPALVLIDELDAHMHPEWQQLLVTTLRETFPRLQVLASTHSPLVVLNMKPGEIITFTRAGHRPSIEARLEPEKREQKASKEAGTEGHEPVPIEVEVVTQPLRGLTAAQALTTVYGLLSTRDVGTAEASLEYDRLATKVPRTGDDEKDLRRLAEALKLRLPEPGETAEVIQAREMIKRMYAQRLKEMSSDKQDRLMQEVTLQLLEIATGSRRPTS